MAKYANFSGLKNPGFKKDQAHLDLIEKLKILYV